MATYNGLASSVDVVMTPMTANAAHTPLLHTMTIS